MGGIELDLRDATLDPGVTQISAVAVMGGVVVTVPPNVRLECDGFAFMGGFEDQLKAPASGDPNAPVVKLTGFAFMGGVEVRVLEPGAPTED
jgi:predicted membrane protein